MDEFTRKRLIHFVEQFRFRSGELPTLQDFEAAGMNRELVDRAVRDEVLEQFYVTLTSGTIKKAYKIKTTSL